MPLEELSEAGRTCDRCDGLTCAGDERTIKPLCFNESADSILERANAHIAKLTSELADTELGRKRWAREARVFRNIVTREYEDETQMMANMREYYSKLRHENRQLKAELRAALEGADGRCANADKCACGDVPDMHTCETALFGFRCLRARRCSVYAALAGKAE